MIYYLPYCALLPLLREHIRHSASWHAVESTQARPDPTAGSTPSRSVATLSFVRRLLPLTEPRHLCGLAGHESGGALHLSCASQEARTVGPCSTGFLGWLCRRDRGSIGSGEQAVTQEYLETIRRPSGPPGHMLRNATDALDAVALGASSYLLRSARRTRAVGDELHGSTTA